MNYIKQLNEFWNWAMINSISQSEITLYLAILQCANISNWKSGLNLPNSTLMSFAKISNPSQLNKVRNRLVQTGLIKYQRGKGNSCGTYTIVKLYSQMDNQMDNQTDSKWTTNGQSNGQQMDNIYKQNKTKQNNTIPPIFPRGESVPYKEITDLYNAICTRLPKVTTLNDSRKRAIKTRFLKHGIDGFRDVFEKANKSDFLTGDNRTGWVASFDWLLKDSNFVKVAEDTYENRGSYRLEMDKQMDKQTDYDEIERIMREKM